MGLGVHMHTTYIKYHRLNKWSNNYILKGEDAIEFANRVKREIAKKGGLVDLVWDGNLKRTGVKKEWIAAQQENFSRRIKVD